MLGWRNISFLRLHPEVILSEQELHQLEEHDQRVQAISAADLYLLYH